MIASGKPTQHIREPPRSTPVLASPEIAVVGGGVAGVSAAIAAARAGADVMLVERYGSFGGLATGGAIALLLTLDDGRGRQVIGGLCQEVVERLHKLAASHVPARELWGSQAVPAVEHERRYGLIWGGTPPRVRYSVAYDPEALRLVLQALVEEAGVEPLLHSVFADAVLEGDRITALAFQTKTGRRALRPKVVVDATGDGDVFASAGCGFELERVYPWLWYRVGGIEDVDQAIDAGAGLFKTPNPGQALLPWGSAARLARKIDATDSRDLTFAELACRREVMAHFEQLRQTIPGMSRAHLCGVATQLGITESRRLQGRHLLRREDRNCDHPEAIALTGHWTKPDVVYAIPYGCLIPHRPRNLLVAGRNISVEHPVHNATKEIPAAMATGQAAGLAAVAALRCGADASGVDVGALRRCLISEGAILEYPFDS